MRQLDPNKMKIGYVVLTMPKKRGSIIEREQLRAGFTINQSKYTHVLMSIGGYHGTEAVWPKSGIVNIQKKYVDKGRQIKVIKYLGKDFMERKRYKVALWSATKCNLRYGFFAVPWFKLKNIFKLKGQNFLARLSYPFCSFKEAWAFYMEGYILIKGIEPRSFCPAHFGKLCDNGIFEEVDDIWEE